MNIEICGDWAVRVVGAGTQAGPVHVDVKPPPAMGVSDEACGPLPVFNPSAGGWAIGYRLAGVLTQETTVQGALTPGSLRQFTRGPAGKELIRGRDYEADLDWGTVGRLAGGVLTAETAVFASYDYSKSRLDSIVNAPDGRLSLRQGGAHVTCSVPPELAAGEQRLANIWIPGRLERLTSANLFPVLETCYPEPPKSTPPPAARLVPEVYAKLVGGQRLRILAWGDSVTEASYLPNPALERWQAQFVSCLREKYPKADIDLTTEAWGGRNTTSYLGEPPGSVHNYREKVLAGKPDLVVSEFVNDGGYSVQRVEEVYGRLAGDFRAIGAEWIILTPHYVLPGWMGLDRQNNIDEDPRVYVGAVREFAARHRIAVADASRRWGRLWRQGLPYMTFMMNAINHPDPRGMRIFADSLMELF